VRTTSSVSRTREDGDGDVGLEDFLDVPPGSATTTEEFAQAIANRKKYSFPYVLSTRLQTLNAGVSPTTSGLPRFKSQLTVALDHLPFTSRMQRAVFIRLCGVSRIKRGQVSFTSRREETQQLNEQRVFSWLDGCMAESARLAELFLRDDPDVAAAKMDNKKSVTAVGAVGASAKSTASVRSAARA